MSKFAALTLAALLSTPAVALATPAPTTAPGEVLVTLHVTYGDLDVRAPAGARVLMDRIARAANNVCGGWPDSLIHDDRVRFDRCRTDAYGRAVKQLDPQVIAAVSDYSGQAAHLGAN